MGVSGLRAGDRIHYPGDPGDVGLVMDVDGRRATIFWVQRQPGSALHDVDEVDVAAELSAAAPPPVPPRWPTPRPWAGGLLLRLLRGVLRSVVGGQQDRL